MFIIISDWWWWWWCKILPLKNLVLMHCDAKMQKACTAAHFLMYHFNAVSPSVCEENIRLMFTVLERSTLPVVRANAIIALGDLTVRFPNILEPWTQNLYARLVKKPHRGAAAMWCSWLALIRRENREAPRVSCCPLDLFWHRLHFSRVGVL